MIAFCNVSKVELDKFKTINLFSRNAISSLLIFFIHSLLDKVIRQIFDHEVIQVRQDR